MQATCHKPNLHFNLTLRIFPLKISGTMDQSFQTDMDVDTNDPKAEQEIDELEEDDFVSDNESDDIEGGIHDVALPSPAVQMLTTRKLHREFSHTLVPSLSLDLDLHMPYRYDS